jgi:hypothetical protein
VLWLATAAVSEETPDKERRGQCEQIVKRNVFNQSFGPSEPAPGAAATTTVTKPSPETLTGILRLDGQYMAMVENKETRSSQLLRVGSQVMDAKVAAIDDAKIELEKDGQRRTVELGEALGTVSVAAPVPSSAPTPSATPTPSPTTTSSSAPRPPSPVPSSTPPMPSDKLQALMEAMRKRREGQLK